MSTERHDQWDIDHLLAGTFLAGAEFHQTLQSTNDRALELASDADVALPHLVLADQQTRGRGRGRNNWWSSAGSLTFSLLLELDADRLPMVRWPELSLTVGSSICSALDSLIPDEDVGLKWPNDVYLRGAKVSGVLVEVPPRIAGRVVIGIGLNVANSVGDAPDDVRLRAIALCDVGGPTSRQTVLISLLCEFDTQLQLLIEDPDAIRRRWRKHDLLIGRSVTIDDGRTLLCGTAAGIDDDGALLLRTEAGIRRCYGGVVQALD